MFIGIDGTGPELLVRTKKDAQKYFQDNANSHVRRLFRICHEDRRVYMQGPTTLGGDSSEIASRVVHMILDYSKSGDKKIFLAGHSRGGAIAIDACIRLERIAKTQPKLAELKIECVALFDAVKRDPALDAATIPQNVKLVFHARRDPRVDSRALFGNTATKYIKGITAYQEQFFLCTHAAVGGTPWTGDHPYGQIQVWNQQEDDRGELAARFPDRAKALAKEKYRADLRRAYLDPKTFMAGIEITSSQDHDGARQVWSWMLSRLVDCGLMKRPVSNG